MTAKGETLAAVAGTVDEQIELVSANADVSDVGTASNPAAADGWVDAAAGASTSRTPTTGFCFLMVGCRHGLALMSGTPASRRARSEG